MRVLSIGWVLLIACSGQVDGNHDGPDAGPEDVRRTCVKTVECPADQIRDLTAGYCRTTVTCTMHSDCGGAAYCSADGTCKVTQTGAPCSGSGDCQTDEECLGGHCGCGAQFVTGNRVPPNVLIALDRSDSMNDIVDGTSPAKSRWTVAKEAIASLLTTYGGQVRFGLKLWPGSNLVCNAGGNCSAGFIAVDTGEMTATMINADLAGASTCTYGTPITLAVSSLLTYTGLEDPARDNFLVLITDGQQMSCTGDPVAAVTSLRMETPEVKTFVIGFSGDVDGTQLTAMANAGGTARPGTPKYYQANDAAGLAEAFDDIAKSVISCDYNLDTVPPDPGLLYVYFGAAQLPRDATHANGWDYNAGTNDVSFYGATCTTIRTGNLADLAIVYGCPIIIE